jgi:hypothetical protein
MWMIFLAGLAIIVFRSGDRWKAYDQAQRIPRFKNGLPSTDYIREAGYASLRLIVPVWIWMLVFGIPMIIIDIIFGPPAH